MKLPKRRMDAGDLFTWCQEQFDGVRDTAIVKSVQPLEGPCIDWAFTSGRIAFGDKDQYGPDERIETITDSVTQTTVWLPDQLHRIAQEVGIVWSSARTGRPRRPSCFVRTWASRLPWTRCSRNRLADGEEGTLLCCVLHRC